MEVSARDWLRRVTGLACPGRDGSGPKRACGSEYRISIVKLSIWVATFRPSLQLYDFIELYQSVMSSSGSTVVPAHVDVTFPMARLMVVNIIAIDRSALLAFHAQDRALELPSWVRKS